MYIFILIIALLSLPVRSFAAADKILGVDSATGVSEALSAEDALSLIGSTTWTTLLASGAIVTSESDPLKIRGSGGQSTNGFNLYQHSGGTPTIKCVIANVEGDCDITVTLDSGNSYIIKNSSGTTIFQITNATGAITNATLDCEATGNACTVKRYKWIPAAGCNNATASTVWDLPASNPAVPACRSGTNTTKGVLDFADGGNLSAQYNEYLHEDWTGAIDATIIYEANSTSTNNTVWQIAIACAGDGESDDPAFTDDEFTADAGKATAHQYNATVANTVTTTGSCATGKMMHIRIKRDSGHASDNLAATARFVGLSLKLRELQ